MNDEYGFFFNSVKLLYLVVCGMVAVVIVVVVVCNVSISF